MRLFDPKRTCWFTHALAFMLVTGTSGAETKRLSSYECYVEMKTYAVFATASAYSETHAASIVSKRYRNGEVQWCRRRN